MKHGFRKPSFRKSIAARTVSKSKRALKKALIPNYCKKGMSIFHPSRSAYNKLYRQTTIGINDFKKTTYNNTYSNTSNCQSNLDIIFYVIITIFVCIGIWGFIWFAKECFGPCNHNWEYVSYNHNYQCTKCRELKSQNECIHNWEILKNNTNWFQRKCTKCEKIETEKRF